MFIPLSRPGVYWRPPRASYFLQIFPYAHLFCNVFFCTLFCQKLYGSNPQPMCPCTIWSTNNIPGGFFASSSPGWSFQKRSGCRLNGPNQYCYLVLSTVDASCLFWMNLDLGVFGSFVISTKEMGERRKVVFFLFAVCNFFYLAPRSWD